LAAVLAVGMTASLVAEAAPATTPAKAVDLRVTSQLRTSLRAVFLQRNQRFRAGDVAGPLWGRPCVAAMEELYRSRCIEYTRYKGYEYVSALFTVRTAENRPREQTFTRRITTKWKTVGGYGYTPPLPCPVLKAWDRAC
jgi:hypothetical protein